MKVCVLGLGYIGLPTAAMFAEHGVDVVGVDVSPFVLNELNKGLVHIEEPGLQEIVSKVIINKKLIISEIPEISDAFIIAVPTPFKINEMGVFDGKNYKKADMSFVLSAVKSILPYLRKGNLVVLESTSPPKTMIDLISPLLESTGLKVGDELYVAYSPERVLPGRILIELKNNARVIGGITKEWAERGRDLYSIFVKGEIILTDSTTSEMVKLMENTYRDVNIAIANEFSQLAYRLGVNVWEAIKIANLHPRVNILNPGPGVGGHCISVDPWFLVEAAPDITSLTYSARKVNDSQPEFVIQQIEQILGSIRGKKIAAFGLAYKPDVDDFRESPAIEVVERLLTLGCQVNAYDPFIRDNKEAYIVNSLTDAVIDVDLLVLLVDHTVFKSLEPEFLAKMKQRKILDTKNFLDREFWNLAGFEFYLLGALK